MTSSTSRDAAAFDASVRANQCRLAANIQRRYDDIACGAGTSGSVVAARLAADPDVQVLLLDAGPSDDSPLIHDPNLWPATLGTEFDWAFRCTSNSHLGGRALDYSMGKGLGGGSSINVSTWSRGHAADWNHFAGALRRDRRTRQRLPAAPPLTPQAKVEGSSMATTTSSAWRLRADEGGVLQAETVLHIQAEGVKQ